MIKIANWKTFYKYGTFKKIERLEPIIRDRKYYFAPPSQLNDPSDCRNKIRDHSENEIEEYLIQSNRRFYGHSRGDDYIKEGIKNFGTTVLLEEMTKQFNKLMDERYGVFSLSKRPNNMALWAKYADNHKGCCLEFSDLSKFSNVYEVQYTDKIPLRLSMKTDSSEVEFLYTKSSDWSNEEEARIISKPPGFQIFPITSLRAIILGEHCNANNENIITDWINSYNENILLKKTKFNRSRQEVEFLTIA